jgi:4,5-DOPA dioxygenase extradiol
MPAAFFGHGSPTNALARNRYTGAWRSYATKLPRPSAIVVISAHWYVSGMRITAAARPATIHDFNSRFDPKLFAFAYPAAAALEIADRIVDLLAPHRVERDTTWGIDHGAFSVLAHLFPEADVPVVELSLDRSKPAAWHYALARKLAPLRDEGVAIFGSGNVVHNLELAEFGRGVGAFDWAARFDERFRTLVAAGDHERLIAYAREGDDAKLSVPTPDHYLPFLYVLAQQRTGETFETIVDGFEAGSIGMLALALGR